MRVQAAFCCSTPHHAPGILYETATSINSIFGYAPNKATITHFGANNLPTNGNAHFRDRLSESNPKSISNYHYSLDAQYQLPYEMVATLGYQGSESRHLLGAVELQRDRGVSRS